MEPILPPYDCVHCGATKGESWGDVVPGHRVCGPCYRERMNEAPCQCLDINGRHPSDAPIPPSRNLHRNHRKNCPVIRDLSKPIKEFKDKKMITQNEIHKVLDLCEKTIGMLNTPPGPSFEDRIKEVHLFKQGFRLSDLYHPQKRDDRKMQFRATDNGLEVTRWLKDISQVDWDKVTIDVVFYPWSSIKFIMLDPISESK